MTRRAILSMDANATYSFPAPIACACWAAAGVKPLVIAVGEVGWESREAALSIEACRGQGAHVEKLPASGVYPAEWWAKSCRLLACLLCEPADYLITADADMAVLDAGFLAQIDAAKAFQIFYANAYQGFRDHLYPICYLGAEARVWRTLVRPASEDLETATRALLARWSDVGRENNANFSDEMILRGLLLAWPDYPNAAQFCGRQQARAMAPARRIDRDGQYAGAEKPIDFHLPRPAWTDEAWASIERHVLPTLPAERQRQLRDYRAQYVGGGQ